MKTIVYNSVHVQFWPEAHHGAANYAKMALVKPTWVFITT